MEDKSFEAGPTKHLAELGLPLQLTLGQEVESETDAERVAKISERRQAVDKQRLAKRVEVSRMRRGSVVADHDDDDEQEDHAVLAWSIPSAWAVDRPTYYPG